MSECEKGVDSFFFILVIGKTWDDNNKSYKNRVIDITYQSRRNIDI